MLVPAAVRGRGWGLRVGVGTRKSHSSQARDTNINMDWGLGVESKPSKSISQTRVYRTRWMGGAVWKDGIPEKSQIGVKRS